MTVYETIFIIHPAQGGRVKELIDKFKKTIEGLEGTFIHVEEWGLRDLAYQIQKQSKGHYILFQYQSSARAVGELERNMKLTDGVLRYLTVRLDEDVQVRPQSEPIELSEEVKKGSEEAGAEPKLSS